MALYSNMPVTFQFRFVWFFWVPKAKNARDLYFFFFRYNLKVVRTRFKPQTSLLLALGDVN